MERFRRALFAWTIAGLGTATGCATDTGSGGPKETARAQQPVRPAPRSYPPAPPVSLAAGKNPPTSATPAAEASPAPLPINLATAFKLSAARPLDVQIATQQVTAAATIYDRARVLWLSNVSLGTDYSAKTGLQQVAAPGAAGKSNRNAFAVGSGSNAMFALSDAIYTPLAARREPRPRPTLNDPALATAEAYFALQQARGDLAGALATEARAEELLRETTELADEPKARTELGRWKQAVSAARERERLASAELARVLSLPPLILVEPAEPSFLPITVIDPSVTLDELVPVALTARTELAENQALVQAALARLKQDKLRPLVPSHAVRSVPANASESDGAEPFAIDAERLREVVAIGFGDKAQTNERREQLEGATIDVFRTQDRIATEVATAFAHVRATAQRLNAAEPALREALKHAQKRTGPSDQTRRVNPQDALDAIGALSRANAQFFAAVADYNRAQFRLYCALGHPTQCLANPVPQLPLAVMPIGPTPEMKPSAQPAPLANVPQVPGEALPVAITPAPIAPPAPIPPSTPAPNPRQPLPVQEWTSVPGGNRPPTVVEEPPLPSPPLPPPVVVPELGN